MTRWTCAMISFALLVLLGAANPPEAASAPKAEGDRTRFYDFDELLIDGEINKPATVYTRALKSPLFDRLLRLQKSFLDQISRTSRDPGLRWFK
ncbi:MAG: hypothetical protein RBU30_00160 [Polyangia bacterium]|jgi:hypothetical protein|nr:hypothetical protein [Polyangia bacterium]